MIGGSTRPIRTVPTNGTFPPGPVFSLVIPFLCINFVATKVGRPGGLRKMAFVGGLRHREAAGSNAEVDYVVHKKGLIYPIEAKASNRGSMQSLRQFIKEKQSPHGIRMSLEPFAQYEDIVVVPLYAVANWEFYL